MSENPRYATDFYNKENPPFSHQAHQDRLHQKLRDDVTFVGLEDWKIKGFDSWAETARGGFTFLQLLNQRVNYDLVLEKVINGREGNWRGVLAEFFQNQQVLLNPIRFGLHRRRRRILGALGDEPLLDMTSKEERKGEVYRQVAKAEAFMIKRSKRGQSKIKRVLVVSPPGESDQTFQGKKMFYPEGQLYFWEKTAEGALQAVTVVVPKYIKNDVYQLFLQKVGVPAASFRKNVSEFEQSIDVLKNSQHLAGNKAPTIEQMVQTLEKTCLENQPSMAKDIKKDFNQIFQKIEDFRIGKLNKIDRGLKEIIEQGKRNIRPLISKLGSVMARFNLDNLNEENQASVINRLKETEVGRLFSRYLNKTALELQLLVEQRKSTPTRQRPPSSLSFFDYQQAFHLTQFNTGCILSVDGSPQKGLLRRPGSHLYMRQVVPISDEVDQITMLNGGREGTCSQCGEKDVLVRCGWCQNCSDDPMKNNPTWL